MVGAVGRHLYIGGTTDCFWVYLRMETLKRETGKRYYSQCSSGAQTSTRRTTDCFWVYLLSM